MPKQNLIKILIPVIAIVLIVESIILVSKLGKNVVTTNVTTDVVEEVEQVREPVADFVFETETKEMKVGKSYQVNLNLVGSKEVNLDAIETYVKYDSDKVTISKLTASKDLPQTLKAPKVDTKTGLISAVFIWENEGEYYSVKTNEVTPVLSFTVTPKVAGETSISLVEADGTDTSSTLLVESVTSNKLLFLSNKLEISAVK